MKLMHRLSQTKREKKEVIETLAYIAMELINNTTEHKRGEKSETTKERK
jgi:hypothetical protein